MGYRTPLTRILTPVISIALSIPFSLQAQGFIEEVVVTAQKREESIQDVPIAINALTGDQLDALGIRDTDDIVNFYPGLTIQTASAVNSGFTIRGVGTDNFHITGQQAVGQYMDGVSMLSPFTSNIGLFDMERLEVMRGPQNTLFGRNTTGGAVNFITRKPEVGGELSGYGRITGGNEDRIDFEGAVEIPLGDTAAARISVSTENRGAIFNNLVPGAADVGDIERHAVRGQLAWEPTNRTGVLLNFHAAYSRGSRTPSRGLGIWDANGTFPVNATDNTGAAVVEPLATALANGDTISGPVHDCPVARIGHASYEGIQNCVSWIPRTPGLVTNPSTSDWNDVFDHGNPKADFDFEGVFLKINHDFESFAFESITSYDEITADFLSTNATTLTGDGFYPGQAGKFEVFSQEARLTSMGDSPLRWILGGYYSTEDDRLATIINRTDHGSPPFGLVPSITVDQDVTIWSIYGQAEYDVIDNGTFTVGVRFTDDSKEGISTARVAAFTDTGTPPGARFPLGTYISLADFDALTDPPSGPCPPPVGGFPCSLDIPVEQNLTEFGWKVGYDHQFTDDFMGYVSYSRGFKSGAFDTRALAAFAGTADQPVAPEFLDAYEVGFKSSLLEGMVELNAALYFYQWEDRQTFDVDNLGRPAFVNIPEAEIIGAELEVKWAPGDGWYIQGGLSLIDSEITDDGGLLSIANGSPLSHTPEISFTGLFAKDIPIGANKLTLQTNFKFDDESNTSLDNDPESNLESTFILNARASYYFGSEQQYEFSLWADNITAEKVCGTDDTLDSLNYQFTCVPNPGMVFYGATFSTQF